MAEVYLTIEYRRGEDVAQSGSNKDNTLIKEYRISTFLKNYIEALN